MTLFPQQADLTDEQFESISDLVRDLCGINLHTGKEELVKARLGKRLKLLGMRSFEDYIEMVRTDGSGDELKHMLDALSTNLTEFFREPRHFTFLREKLLPQLTGRIPRRLRIWSAGCSSGEEAYTIAMVVAESLRDIDLWDAGILATDLSTKVLTFAREGVYSEEKMAGVPRELVGKYFEKRGDSGEYLVREKLRRMISFARLNLLGPWPMKGPFDAIFCRNVMIYFNRETQIKTVERFTKLLAPGGLLLVGHSESLTSATQGLKYVEPAIYRRP